MKFIKRINVLFGKRSIFLNLNVTFSSVPVDFLENCSLFAKISGPEMMLFMVGCHLIIMIFIVLSELFIFTLVPAWCTQQMNYNLAHRICSERGTYRGAFEYILADI